MGESLISSIAMRSRKRETTNKREPECGVEFNRGFLFLLLIHRMRSSVSFDDGLRHAQIVS